MKQLLTINEVKTELVVVECNFPSNIELPTHLEPLVGDKVCILLATKEYPSLGITFIEYIDANNQRCTTIFKDGNSVVTGLSSTYPFGFNSKGHVLVCVKDDDVNKSTEYGVYDTTLSLITSGVSDRLTVPMFSGFDCFGITSDNGETVRLYGFDGTELPTSKPLTYMYIHFNTHGNNLLGFKYKDGTTNFAKDGDYKNLIFKEGKELPMGRSLNQYHGNNTATIYVHHDAKRSHELIELDTLTSIMTGWDSISYDWTSGLYLATVKDETFKSFWYKPVVNDGYTSVELHSESDLTNINVFVHDNFAPITIGRFINGNQCIVENGISGCEYNNISLTNKYVLCSDDDTTYVYDRTTMEIIDYTNQSYTYEDENGNLIGVVGIFASILRDDKDEFVIVVSPEDELTLECTLNYLGESHFILNDKYGNRKCINQYGHKEKILILNRVGYGEVMYAVKDYETGQIIVSCDCFSGTLDALMTRVHIDKVRSGSEYEYNQYVEAATIISTEFNKVSFATKLFIALNLNKLIERKVGK
jgi:hypothetical protein